MTEGLEYVFRNTLDRPCLDADDFNEAWNTATSKGSTHLFFGIPLVWGVWQLIVLRRDAQSEKGESE
jgi:hypothetical protein